MIAIPLSAVATLLERFRIPRAVGALIGLLIGFGVLAGILVLVIPTFVDEVRTFADQAPSTFDALKSKIADASGDQPSHVGVQIKDFINGYTNDPAKLIGPIATIGKAHRHGARRAAPDLDHRLLHGGSATATGGWSAANIPPEGRERAREVMERIRGASIGWMQGVLIGMFINGFLLWAGLELIGLDFAVLFAVFSAVLILIPCFGTPLGAIPPVAYGLSQSPGTALVVLAVYVGVHVIESYVTMPLVMANTRQAPAGRRRDRGHRHRRALRLHWSLRGGADPLAGRDPGGRICG